MRDPISYRELIEKRLMDREMDPKSLGRQIAEAQLRLLGKDRLEHHLNHIGDLLVMPDEIKGLYGKLEDRVLRQAIEGYKEALEGNHIHFQGNLALLSFTSNYFASEGVRTRPTA